MDRIEHPYKAADHIVRIETVRHLRAAADLAEHGEGRIVLDHIDEAERLARHLKPERYKRDPDD